MSSKNAGVRLAALAAAICAALALAVPAAALVTAYAEPVYTKTSGNNAFFFNWQAITGVDGSGNTDYSYYLCFRTYRNGILEENFSGPPADCDQKRSATSPSPASGNDGYMPFALSTQLADGATYEFCATDFWRRPFGFNSGASSCGVTTIDRNAPSVVVFVNGTDQYTNNPNLQFRIDYTDPTSPPWPANYRCIKFGTPCTGSDTFNYDPNCSNMAGPSNSRINQFFCQADVSSAPDGPIYFCAAASDRAVPDNPQAGATNQFIDPATGSGWLSNKSNISSFGCGNVTLDRVAPQVSATASATSVHVGDLVNFSASSTDAASGIAGGYSWTFGDNTAPGAGSNVSHTYTQPGTFEAAVRTRDGAGNEGVGKVIVTVSAGTGNNTGSGGTVTGPTTPNDVNKGAGGGGTTTGTVGALRVTVPKRFTVRSKRPVMRIALSPNKAGKVDLVLLKGTRVAAKAAGTFGQAGTYGIKMKLPAKIKAGLYKLKITFRPADGGAAVAKKFTIRIVRKTAGGSAPRAASAAGGRATIRGGAPYEAHPQGGSSKVAVTRLGR